MFEQDIHELIDKYGRLPCDIANSGFKKGIGTFHSDVYKVLFNSLFDSIKYHEAYREYKKHIFTFDQLYINSFSNGLGVTLF